MVRTLCEPAKGEALATTFTHAVLAGAAATAFGGREKPLRLYAVAILVSVLPDADVIGFRFGVRYGAFLGHRGFFHSPFFALTVSVLCVAVLFRHLRPFSAGWWKHLALFFLLGASHGLFDAATDGGLGVALLAPFDNTRHFLRWTPIPVSPIGLRAFLQGRGLRVIIWEIAYLWAPASVAAALLTLRRGRLPRPEDPGDG